MPATLKFKDKWKWHYGNGTLVLPDSAQHLNTKQIKPSDGGEKKLGQTERKLSDWLSVEAFATSQLIVIKQAIIGSQFFPFFF